MAVMSNSQSIELFLMKLWPNPQYVPGLSHIPRIATIRRVRDSPGTNRGLGHNFIKNSSIDLELDIIAMLIEHRTVKTSLQKCTYFFDANRALLKYYSKLLRTGHKRMILFAITPSKIIQ